jgi:hypothetical protein
MTDTDTLELVGILPLLADEVFAAADAHLRLHFGGRALAAGGDISVAEVRWHWSLPCPACWRLSAAPTAALIAAAAAGAGAAACGH